MKFVLMGTHVGYATGTMKKFRYEGDPREIQIEMSREAAEAVVDACNGHPDAAVEDSPLEQVHRILVEILAEDEDDQ